MIFDELKDLYQDVIMDRGRKPRHGRRLEVFDATARGDNPMCGDRVQVWVKTDGETIEAAGFEARGCAISIASADLMTDVVVGRSGEAARTLFGKLSTMARTGDCPDCGPEMETLRPLAGVHDYPSRVKCVTLPWHALLAALEGKGEASSE